MKIVSAIKWSLMILLTLTLAACSSPDDNGDTGSVTSVTIQTPNGTEVAVGGTLQLDAEVVVIRGASQDVNWSSSNTAVATVNDSGLVTAVTAGSTEITATSTEDSSKSDSVTITVTSTGGGSDTGLTKATAQELAPLAVQSNQFFVSLFSGFSAGFLPTATSMGLTPQQSGGCVTTVGGAIDNDGDGIPVSVITTFTCSFEHEGVTLSISGSFSMKDKNDSNPNSGYHLEFNNFEFDSTSEGETAAFSADGFFDLTVSDTEYHAAMDLNFSGSSSTEGDFAVSIKLDATYVPENASDPFATGTLTYTASLDSTYESESYSLNAQTTPTLEVDSGCLTGFSGGAATYTDSAGNELVVSYTCDNATVTFEGEVILP